MSRAPRGQPYAAQGEAGRAAGTPYGSAAALTRLRAAQDGALTTTTTNAATANNNNTNGVASGPPRLTIHNFASFNARVKKLPPDANTAAALTAKLYQFPERVCFACAKCRRDNVRSDSVAIDLRNRVILCTACFTRIIRPRTYRPTRVVPFPSLLSWLNYKPARASEVAEDVMSRPAEAVAPSGQRVATAMLGAGDRPTDLAHLPAIAMNVVATRNTNNTNNNNVRSSGNVAQGGVGRDGEAERHPCLRIWGSCVHGETCLFRNAPYDLCLAFLMGLCSGEAPQPQPQQQKKASTSGKNACSLLHQEIYDLPQHTDPAPAVRYVGDLDETLLNADYVASNRNDAKEKEEASKASESEWARWLGRRRRSPNMAEWQLWHNGPLGVLLDQYVPAIPRPVPASEASTAGATGQEEGEGAPQPPVKLNLSDIMSALHQIKKDQ